MIRKIFRNAVIKTSPFADYEELRSFVRRAINNTVGLSKKGKTRVTYHHSDGINIELYNEYGRHTNFRKVPKELILEPVIGFSWKPPDDLEQQEIDMINIVSKELDKRKIIHQIKKRRHDLGDLNIAIIIPIEPNVEWYGYYIKK